MADPNPNQPPIVQTVANQVNNPSLPAGTEVTYTPITEKPEEIITTAGLTNPAPNVETTNVTAQQGQAQQAPGTTPQATASNVDAQNIVNQYSGVSTYDPTKIEAAQGQVNDGMLVDKQFERLFQDVDANGIPKWAQASTRNANATMGARGLGASTMAMEAIQSAIINSALPIASQNAQTEAQMAFQNLNNRQQALLSNQAAENAAKQFNATSENQSKQFFANLYASIESQNANRQSEMSKFNTGLQAEREQFNVQQANQMEMLNVSEANKVATENANRKTSVEQFNANMKNDREKFNVENQRIIDQSNVQWRRQINTANTAGINAANQTNAQNMFNMSMQSQAQLWQQWRDEASWAWQSNENQLNRQQQIAMAAIMKNNTSDLMDEEMTNNFWSGVGNFVIKLIGNL